MVPYWKCVLAALPALVLGMQFVLAALGHRARWVWDREWLTVLMQVEIFAINSVVVLGLLAVWKPVEPARRKLRAGLFWGGVALYVSLVASFGPDALLTFVLLTFATYLGMFMSWHSETAGVQLGLRFAIAFVAFLAAGAIAGAPRDIAAWKGDPALLEAGAIYFLFLGALELTGLYLRGVPRLLAMQRKALP